MPKPITTGSAGSLPAMKRGIADEKGKGQGTPGTKVIFWNAETCTESKIEALAELMCLNVVHICFLFELPFSDGELLSNSLIERLNQIDPRCQDQTHSFIHITAPKLKNSTDQTWRTIDAIIWYDGIDAKPETRNHPRYCDVREAPRISRMGLKVGTEGYACFYRPPHEILRDWNYHQVQDSIKYQLQRIWDLGNVLRWAFWDCTVFAFGQPNLPGLNWYEEARRPGASYSLHSGWRKRMDERTEWVRQPTHSDGKQHSVILTRSESIRLKTKPLVVKVVKEGDEKYDNHYLLEEHYAIIFETIKDRKLRIKAEPKFAVFFNGCHEQEYKLKVENIGEEAFEYQLRTDHPGAIRLTPDAGMLTRGKPVYCKITVEPFVAPIVPDCRWIYLKHKETGEEYYWRIFYNESDEASEAF